MSESTPASERTVRMTAIDDYWNGVRDGGLAVLAEALGVPADHPVDTQIMGRRIKVTIEWPDGEPREIDVVRSMVRAAQGRMKRDGSEIRHTP